MATDFTILGHDGWYYSLSMKYPQLVFDMVYNGRIISHAFLMFPLDCFLHTIKKDTFREIVISTQDFFNVNYDNVNLSDFEHYVQYIIDFVKNSFIQNSSMPLVITFVLNKHIIIPIEFLDIIHSKFSIFSKPLTNIENNIFCNMIIL